MQLRVFTIPLHASDEQQEEMNRLSPVSRTDVPDEVQSFPSARPVAESTRRSWNSAG